MGRPWLLLRLNACLLDACDEPNLGPMMAAYVCAAGLVGTGGLQWPGVGAGWRWLQV